MQRKNTGSVSEQFLINNQACIEKNQVKVGLLSKCTRITNLQMIAEEKFSMNDQPSSTPCHQ